MINWIAVEGAAGKGQDRSLPLKYFRINAGADKEIAISEWINRFSSRIPS
jgi:hypothetical protein